MIYALLDFDLVKKYDVTIEEFITKCKSLDVKIIQYRDKNSDMKDIKERLKKVRSLWDNTLIVNDYIDLIDFADGLHIGQEDLEKYNSIDDIRKKIGKKILGLSTHNEKEIIEANNLDIDYIGLGAYRTTSTKDVQSIGGEKLLEIAKFSNKDVAIIGGVRIDDEIPTKYKVIGSDIFEAIK
jgi:thiamine-phosphate pyrophosphorylase